MKKLNKVALLFASAALAAPLSGAFAQGKKGGVERLPPDGGVLDDSTGLLAGCRHRPGGLCHGRACLVNHDRPHA